MSGHTNEAKHSSERHREKSKVGANDEASHRTREHTHKHIDLHHIWRCLLLVLLRWVPVLVLHLLLLQCGLIHTGVRQRTAKKKKKTHRERAEAWVLF